MNEEKIPTVQEIVARYLPGVDWDSPTSGRVMCPGHLLHSHQPAHRDARVFVNGVPTLTCYHDKCQGAVKKVNDQIRSAWSLFQPPTDPKILAEAAARAQKKYELETRARASLPTILKDFKWDQATIEAEQKIENWFDTSYSIFVKTMFQPGDSIWLGNPEDSGKPHNRANFWTLERFQDLPKLGNYTCASTFKPGTFSRANDNVATTPFMIVEGDKILGEPITDEDKLKNKNACGAVFNWLRTALNLRLRAVVDSGNKSLHGWFDMPAPSVFEELRVVLPALGCDRAMFKPTQPARIPGVMRDNGKPQRLLFIS